MPLKSCSVSLKILSFEEILKMNVSTILYSKIERKALSKLENNFGFNNILLTFFTRFQTVPEYI